MIPHINCQSVCPEFLGPVCKPLRTTQRDRCIHVIPDMSVLRSASSVGQWSMCSIEQTVRAVRQRWAANVDWDPGVRLLQRIVRVCPYVLNCETSVALPDERASKRAQQTHERASAASTVRKRASEESERGKRASEPAISIESADIPIVRTKVASPPLPTKRATSRTSNRGTECACSKPVRGF